MLGHYTANNYAAPNAFISKTTSTYANSLSSTKVFKLQQTNVQEFNGLNNTSTETTGLIYDAFNNPTQSTTIIREGNTPQQTTDNQIVYAAPTNAPYVVGRPIQKNQTVAIYGDTMTTEERYSYDNGGLLREILKKGLNTNYITETNVYDGFGNITRKTISANGLQPRITNYQYDASGRFLIKSIDIEGLATNYTYNVNNGLLISETNPYNLTTTFSYDAWFKKIKTTDYLGKSSYIAYTRNGVNTAVTMTADDGSESRASYNDLGLKVSTTERDLNGNYSNVVYLYDLYNRNYKVSEPSTSSPSQWNETKYDVYGRPTQSIAFTGKITNITYNGLTTTVNDGVLTKTSTKNAIGNMVSMTDTPGGTIYYSYFANGNLKTSSYDGSVTIIEQDGWGRKTKLTDPSAGVYTYTYNDLGEALTETTPNGTTTYTLDAVGKVEKKTIVGTNTNSQTNYLYDEDEEDGITKLLTKTIFIDVLENNATTTTAYTYDGYKRVESTIETTPYASFTKAFTYDGFGRLETENSIASTAGKTSSKTIKHTYKNGYAWQILDLATQQILWQTNTVNARGQLTSANYGNGLALSKTYDNFGYITQSKVFNGGWDLVNLNTTFEPVRANLTSRTSNLFGWRTENFQYDALDRLTHYTNAQGIQVEQMYETDGRIKENELGTYNYSDTDKKYRNTSLDPSAQGWVHYQNSNNLNITYNTFKSPYEIEETGIDKISFLYNDANNRSTMFYGGTQTDKLQRPYRKHYSADGSMEIKQNMVTGAIEFITYIGGDGYTAPIVLKSDGTTQNYLY